MICCLRFNFQIYKSEANLSKHRTVKCRKNLNLQAHHSHKTHVLASTFYITKQTSHGNMTQSNIKEENISARRQDDEIKTKQAAPASVTQRFQNSFLLKIHISSPIHIKAHRKWTRIDLNRHQDLKNHQANAAQF